MVSFSRCVTSALFLGNMLRARKYRFALGFRVLSNQYVERNAYANAFKFNREKERFERDKLNSRCFTGFRSPCWSPSDGLQQGVSIVNIITFSDTFSRITRVRNIAHPQNLGTLFIFNSSSIFQFLDSIYKMVSHFIFCLRDN